MRRRVLVIDNDPVLNKINEKVLASSGFVRELHFVNHGQQAINYLTSRAASGFPLPDLIILELHLPIMDGFEFIEHYNKTVAMSVARPTLVVFTTSSNPRDKSRAHGLGVDHYLNKPYLLRGLQGIIHQLQTTR